MQAFHAGRLHDLPAFYRAHVARRLGRYAHVLSRSDLRPVHPVTVPQTALAKEMSRSVGVRAAAGGVYSPP
jgi:hypothetical protein